MKASASDVCLTDAGLLQLVQSEPTAAEHEGHMDEAAPGGPNIIW